MVDVAKLARKISRCLGGEVEIKFTDTRPSGVAFYDKDLDINFFAPLATPSSWETAIKSFHEMIYRSRGRAIFKYQGGLCAICGAAMRGTDNTEIDHIESRGAHGRNDRMENLRVVHGNPCHRKRHGG